MVRSLETAYDFERIQGTEFHKKLLAASGPAEWPNVIQRTLVPYRVPAFSEMVRDDLVAVAFIDGGIWKVKCPWCPSAQEAAITDRRFWCVQDGCRNGRENGADGHAIRVQFPAPMRLMQIEALLECRPQMRFQEWHEPETVAQLWAENLANSTKQHPISMDALPKIIARCYAERWKALLGPAADRILESDISTWKDAP